MTDYKKTSRNIRIAYAAVMAVTATFAALCESNTITVEGMLTTLDAGTMYIVEVTTLFAVGISLFAALKGYDWLLHHKVQTTETELRTSRYVRFNYTRIGLLGALMLIGTFFYYATLENWGMYYGLSAFVASFFCLPSAEGVEIEMAIEK